MLGVPPRRSNSYGAVSRETAEAMAQGALAHSPADLAVSITGIAGPGRRHRRKSRSGWCISPRLARAAGLIHREQRFGDIGRAEVRRRSVLQALAMLRELRETLQRAKPLLRP